MTVLRLLSNKWQQRSERNSHIAANCRLDNQGLNSKLCFPLITVFRMAFRIQILRVYFFVSFNTTAIKQYQSDQIRQDDDELGKMWGKVMLYF